VTFKPERDARTQDTKAAQEVGALADFHAMLGQDSARAFYGPGHVRAAADLGAVQTLLLSDTLFRVNDVAKVTPPHNSVVQLSNDVTDESLSAQRRPSW